MPKMLWDPETGLPVTFSDDETPPSHFLPHHPDDVAKAPKAQVESADEGPAPPAPPVIKPLTKAEVVDALNMGKIDFDKTAKVGELTDLLVDNLKKALASAGRPFADDAEPRTLLDLVVGKQ